MQGGVSHDEATKISHWIHVQNVFEARVSERWTTGGLETLNFLGVSEETVNGGSGRALLDADTRVLLVVLLDDVLDEEEVDELQVGEEVVVVAAGVIADSETSIDDLEFD